MEPLTLAFVTVMFVLAFYLVVSVRKDLQKKAELERRQRTAVGRIRGR